MKRIIIALTILALPLTSIAQGEFIFSNQSITPAAPIYLDYSGSSRTIDASYSVDYVYATAAGVTDVSQLTLKGVDNSTGLPYTSTQIKKSGGIFSGGIQDIYDAHGAPYYGTISLQIRAWETSAGSFENALYGMYLCGDSAIITLPLGSPNSSPPGNPTSLSGYFSSFAIAWIPEPSTIALSVMGLSLLVFRRRK